MGDQVHERPSTQLAQWAALAASSPPLAVPARRTIVIAPHPDDETLGAAGLIMHQRDRGIEVAVVALTDGEAAYPDQDPTALAATRRAEQVDALRALGVPADAVIRLGLPDGSTEPHEDLMARSIADLVHDGDVVVAPWVHDQHPDHEAAARAVGRAVAGRDCVVLSWFFWAQHLVDPRDHPGLRLATLELDAGQMDRRRRAIRAHRSQLAVPDGTPILDVSRLRRLDEPTEYYVIGTG